MGPVAVAVATPVVNSVGMAGGAANIAPNGWVEIKGTGLAPLNVPVSGVTWSDAPEFFAGRMPTDVGAVTVTIDGKPAYVYFFSPTQVNVLAPVDLDPGAVPVVVTSGGRSSAPFNVTVRAAAPSFPVFDAKYIIATHADYTLVGPTSLSAPGYPVAPAKPGETIVLYGFGFGLPTPALVNGASSQFGELPALR